MARLKEDLYSRLLYKEIVSWFGITLNEHQQDGLNKPAVTLLQQQLSVELIYTILYTITKYTVGKSKNTDYREYKLYDFDSFNQVPIDFMIVQEPKTLQVAQIPDYLLDNAEELKRKKTVAEYTRK